MKVFITYCKGGYNDQVVDQVFFSQLKACQYVVEKDFRHNEFYKNHNEQDLLSEAQKYIDVVNVVE